MCEGGKSNSYVLATRIKHHSFPLWQGENHRTVLEYVLVCTYLYIIICKILLKFIDLPKNPHVWSSPHIYRFSSTVFLDILALVNDWPHYHISPQKAYLRLSPFSVCLLPYNLTKLTLTCIKIDCSIIKGCFFLYFVLKCIPMCTSSPRISWRFPHAKSLRDCTGQSLRDGMLCKEKP